VAKLRIVQQLIQGLECSVCGQIVDPRDVAVVVVAKDAVPYRAGAERFWSLCAPSAAKLERTAAVVMMITVMTVIMGIPPFDRKEEGRTKERSCPKKPTPTGPHSSEGKSQGPEILE